MPDVSYFMRRDFFNVKFSLIRSVNFHVLTSFTFFAEAELLEFDKNIKSAF